MNKKQYNHFIPRFYMANFSGNKKCIDKCLLETGRIIRNAKTKTTGGKNFMYGKDGKLENAFMELEGQCSDIISRVIKEEKIHVNSEDYLDLLAFIILSNYRILAVADDKLEEFSAMFRVCAKMYKEHGKLDISDDLIESISAQATIPSLWPLKRAKTAFEVSMDLQLSLIKNVSNLSFITSDFPTAKYNQVFIANNYKTSYGYGHMGFQLFYPISPRYCLVLYDPIPYRKHHFSDNIFVMQDPKSVQAINFLIAGYARKEIYFGNYVSDRTIEKIIKFRNKRIMNKPVSLVGGDHYLIFMSEPSIYNDLPIGIFSVKRDFWGMPLVNRFEGPLRPRARQIRDEDKSVPLEK